jgi:hypothetical protein
MAERRGPTDGKRFKRAVPSGNHKGKKRHASNGPVINRRAGENLCTPEMIENITHLIRAGNYRDVAAASVGISRSTLIEWLTRGARGEQPYATLAAAVEKADAMAEVRDVVMIGKAAELHWQAAAWRLERKNPKRWGRKDAMEITGDEQKPVAITVIKFGDDEVEFS